MKTRITMQSLIIIVIASLLSFASCNQPPPQQPTPGSVAAVASSARQTTFAAATRPIAFQPTGTGFFAVTSGVENPAASSITQGGWTTLVDCNVAGETTQTLAPDGNYTFCGFTWTKKNSANESTSMAIVNGTGLEMFPGHTGGFPSEYGTISCLGSGTADASATSLRIPLSQFNIPNLDWSTQLRVFLDVSAQTLSTGGDGIVWGVDNNPPGGFSGLTTWYSVFGARCSSSSTTPLMISYAYTGSATSTIAPTAVTGFTSWTTANQTSTLWTGSIVPIGGVYEPLLAYGTAYSSGWTTALVPWTANDGSVNNGKGTQPAVGYANQTPTAIGSAMFFFIAGTGNVALSTASMTIDRIRVDYKL